MKRIFIFLLAVASAAITVVAQEPVASTTISQESHAAVAAEQHVTENFEGTDSAVQTDADAQTESVALASLTEETSGLQGTTKDGAAPLLDETIDPIEALGNRVEALESLKNLKVTGYIQTQFQWGEEAASLKVGTANGNPAESFNRLGVRRGRIKFAYETPVASTGIQASAVFQLDITEKGVGLKDAYFNLKDPWFGTLQLRGGVFDRPFGYEISYSSSRRESPERSTVFQTLFPEERDLGAMLVLQPAKTSPWNIIKLEAGLFAGNGIKQETDNKKDFIAHLSVLKEWNAISIGAGASYYNGGVYQGNENVYTMSGNRFVLDSDISNIGKFARREYYGFDAEFSLDSPLGMTKLHGEYLFGQQPGLQNRTASPNASALPAGDTYIRNFSGGYIMLVQYLGATPLALVGKYDWYDPNRGVSGNEAGAGGADNPGRTGAADLAQNTIGFGAMLNFNPNMRLTAYYEINRNEKSTNLPDMNKDLKNNVFTLRLQYKF